MDLRINKVALILFRSKKYLGKNNSSFCNNITTRGVVLKTFIHSCTVVPSYLRGDLSQDPQWMPETMNRTEHCILGFFPMHAYL